VEPEQAEAAEGRRRSPVAWILAVLLLAGAGYGGWVAYNQVSGPGAASGDVPLFTADSSPYKEVPEDPGGEEIPNTDILVLEAPITGEADDDLEVLLPAPEEPLAVEAEDNTDEGIIDVEASGVAEVIDDFETDPLFSSEDVDTYMNDVMTEAANAVPSGLPVPSVKPTPPEQPDETQTASLEAAMENAEFEERGGAVTFSDVEAALFGDTADAQAPETVEGTETAEGGGEEEVASLSSTDGVSRVQIAAYSTRDAATAAWDRLYVNEHDLLADVDALITEAILGNATFYRLQVGAYARASDAEALCSSLKQRDIDCLVVGP